MAQASPSVAGILSKTRVISSDSHIVEPPDLWSSRTGALGDRMPHVVCEADGDWWYVDGKKTMSFLGIQTGDRFNRDSHDLRTSGKFSEVRPASYDPAHYLAENEQDGIWASVIYPSQGLVLYSVPNTETVSAAMRAYNDWIAEFCSHDARRLKGLAMLNVDDVDEAVRELERVRALGLVGALISVAPPAWGSYRLPIYDRLWAAAQDLGMPLSLHVGTDRADPRVGDAAFKLNVKDVPPSRFVNQDYQVRIALSEIIYSGVFERFPKLKIGAIEHELSWIPVFLQRLDYNYTDRPPRGPEWRRFSDPNVLPSDFFKRNVFVSFQEDPYGLRLRDVFTTDVVLWGSDYPHTESTFPRSREILGRILADIDAEEIAMIVSGNAARVYGIDVPA
jgi:predicted TIM-barrel fold metal-dependent hydrolase